MPVALSSVEEARLALLAYLEPFALDERVINRIEVVLEELVSNVVRHASAVNAIAVGAERLDDAVRLTVDDDGAAFNPLDATAPPAFTSIDEATLGGQGIVLLRRLTQSLHYERLGAFNRVSARFATAP